MYSGGQRAITTSRVLLRSRKLLTSNRAASSLSPSHEPEQGVSVHREWLYVDSVLPIQIGRWDLRTHIGLFRQDHLLSLLETRLKTAAPRSFKIICLDPHPKDGGIFVEVEVPNGSDTGKLLQELRANVHKEGGIPGWTGVSRGSIWRVQGIPWKEDMNRYPSPILKVAFEGPDVDEETLYRIMRPYGPIQDITPPSPPPAGMLRAATVEYRSIRAATIARNTMHGWSTADGGSSSPATKIRASYLRPLRAHAVRDWLASHPKIVLPAVVFLLGTLTYTIFDPIRVLMVQAKLEDWFNYKNYKAYTWLRSNTLDVFEAVESDSSSSSSGADSSPGSRSYDKAIAGSHDGQGQSPDGSDEEDKRKQGKENRGWFSEKADRLFSGALGSPLAESEDLEGEAWKERTEAHDALRAYLTDLPVTVAFVHGPQGSGKSRMLQTVLDEVDRKILIVDVAELHKASSDSALLGSLARQTGYRPIFTFLDSANRMIDLASVGLIGQKAGLSTSLPDELTQILNITTSALSRVSASHRAQVVHRLKNEQAANQEHERRERMGRGTWRDGRLDCLAGNGIMSELGGGDERVWESDWDAREKRAEVEAELHKMSQEQGGDKDHRKERGDQEAQERAVEEKWAKQADESRRRKGQEDVKSLPIVVIQNFGATTKEEVLGCLSAWAAGLTQDKVAHVIVISDNRENVKRLAKAMPSKPLNTIALADADTESALSFVKKRLGESGLKISFTPEQTASVNRLGGRASDLESLIYKVQGGQTVEEAIEEIISRGVGELRKSAFGDDIEDAKSLSWSREQAWAIIKRLSTTEEIPYHDVLLDFPFKMDEAALRSMEHAELISIGTRNGRASTIRPGKPVYRYVFQRLVDDPVFRATQEMAYNEKIISSSEASIAKYEQELATLKDIASEEGFGVGSAKQRRAYLFQKLLAAQDKVLSLDHKNSELKKILKKGN